MIFVMTSLTSFSSKFEVTSIMANCAVRCGREPLRDYDNAVIAAAMCD